MSLKNYFNKIVDILVSQAELAGESSENIDKGSNREALVQNFLLRHIPRRFSVAVGGDIFGVNQKKSGQIDIIIAHDISISFLENAKPQFPIESVAAAISVKSNLTGSELVNALENLSTVPQPNERVVRFAPLRPTFDRYLLSQPALIIFAYKGISSHTCLEVLTDYYNKNNSVPLNRMPRAIVVLNKYVVVHAITHQKDARNSDPFDRRLFGITDAENDQRGCALFGALVEISKGLSWLDGTYLNFTEYFMEAYIPEEERKQAIRDLFR